MSIHASLPPFRGPMSPSLLLALVRGLGLPEGARVLDLMTGEGAAPLLLSRELGYHCVGVEADDSLLERARVTARDWEIDTLAQFRSMDPRHLSLPVESYDLILALAGTLSSLGRVSTLERLRFYLRPGGHLLLSEPIYLDSAPDLEVMDALERGRDAEGRPYAIRHNQPSPEVRAVFETGPYGFETEVGLRSLLEALDFVAEWSCLLPESVWSHYFAQAALRGLAEPHERADLAREAIAFYALGGRQSLGFLLLAARRPELEHHDEERR